MHSRFKDSIAVTICTSTCRGRGGEINLSLSISMRETQICLPSLLYAKKTTYLAFSPREKNYLSLFFSTRKKNLPLSIYEKIFFSVDSLLSDHRIYQARAQLYNHHIYIFLTFIYFYLVKHQTTTSNNAKGRPNALFVHPVGLGNNKLHGTSASIQPHGSI